MDEKHSATRVDLWRHRRRLDDCTANYKLRNHTGVWKSCSIKAASHTTPISEPKT